MDGVSIPVALAELAEKIESFGPVAFLVSTGDDGAPHVVSVTAGWEGEALAVGAGSRTGKNASARPTVTLLWPGAPGADYSLIVDGSAALVDDGARLLIQPTRAVLHRLAQASADLPSCVTVYQ
jgi:Pyridoxamine 5'-phosphate oxidase